MFGLLSAAAILAGPSLHAADASLLAVSKIENYLQEKDAPPVLYEPGAFSFYTYVNLTRPDSVLSAKVTLPDGRTESLTSGFSPEVFDFLDFFDNGFQLEDSYPPGPYRLDLETSKDGPQTVSFRLPENF